MWYSHSGGTAADTSWFGRVGGRVFTGVSNSNMVKAVDCFDCMMKLCHNWADLYLHDYCSLLTELLLHRFTEMPTNNYIENSFWNFDALFQPQQHPARDAHDTFFISGKFLFSVFIS